MGKYFDSKGYFIFDDVIASDIPFYFIIGGRGTGKTYGATKLLCDICNFDKKFVFMRRTQAELDIVNAGSIYAEHHPGIWLKADKGLMRVMRGHDDEEECIGYHLALSAVKSVRGFSMLDVSYILFDEFIPERGTPKRKNEGEVLLNAYETINRNRELEGGDPVKMICLSNFNTDTSDILGVFGVTDMIPYVVNAKPIGVYTNEAKTTRLISINESPISEKKARSVLYLATNSESFSDMALKNKAGETLTKIKSYPDNAYTLWFAYGRLRVNNLQGGGVYFTTSTVEKTTISEKEQEFLAKVLDNIVKLGYTYSSDIYADLLLREFIEKGTKTHE